MTTKYSVRNAHKGITLGTNPDYLTYDDEYGLKRLYFEWDYENDTLDKIAEEEFRMRMGDLKRKKNMLWINDLKKDANWKEGEYIYVFTKTNCDGTYYVNWTKNKILKNGSKFWYNIIVEPNGYVNMICFNNYTYNEDEDIKCDFWVRVDSYYNDKVCKLLKKNKK
jgi:hypothetical protein